MSVRPPFEVLRFSEAALFQALSSNACSAEEVSANSRARYIARYLSDLEAKTVVIEFDYIDGDYLEDFASYYVRCYAPYDRRCNRIHFFTELFTTAELTDLVTRRLPELDQQRLIDGYLGFVIARPLPNAVVGRSILRTYPSEGGRRNYTALRRYDANLFGIGLSVVSLPFQEQDTVLAACATVALWSAFHKTAQLFGTPSPRPAEITRIANGIGNSSRSIPSHGLDGFQMAHAIRSVGLEPELVPAKENIALVSVAYAYLRFGLPVVLGVHIEDQGLHAITLVGYSILPRLANTQEIESGYRTAPFTGLRINELYGHDDQIGPFSRLLVKPSGQPSPVVLEGAWVDETDRKLLLKPEWLLIPVYNKIRVTFVDVQKWIERFWESLMPIITDTAGFEWDVYLTSVNALKQRVANALVDNPNHSELLFQQSPRFIWSATLLYKNTKVLELLADATDMERSFPFYSLLWYDMTFKGAVEGLVTAPALQDPLSECLGKRLLGFLKGTFD